MVTESGPDISLSSLQAKLTAFRDARGWDAVHNEKDLAIALSVESAELLELFLWRPSGGLDGSVKRQLESEMADVLAYLLHLAEIAQIDLAAALLEKMNANALRYPATRL